ncbi:hypothetical protein FM119_10660 [Mycetocola reblochoni REB411]|uniref:Glycosyltransferase 2-like domain-containing protein n=1 Tax=Mycetocola reblochoni REB411 TaxID=1255698 RepID=A0A1R4K0W7_9MICO|nr:glycosyltransferase family 2 protein [Mycetocola reblochoni]SJN37862.1 hypothetical protein FM119_10660 [Mycetocola reblochoni REB411]
MNPEQTTDESARADPAPILVSVVIPVFNPGPHMADLIASLRRQSIGLDRMEAIFVDDGSTDGSGEELERLAEQEDWVTVVRQPNSGWPGKPRNVGMDLARGEFVMFSDQDDWLGDEALERMRDYGVANGADVIVGKMVGIRRTVPKKLFEKDIPYASVSNTLLADSMTPHKMFRASFLAATGLRFAEGKRRLEDHLFVTEAYLRARNVSVLSSYDCYFHISRDDGGERGVPALRRPRLLHQPPRGDGRPRHLSAPWSRPRRLHEPLGQGRDPRAAPRHPPGQARRRGTNRARHRGSADSARARPRHRGRPSLEPGRPVRRRHPPTRHRSGGVVTANARVEPGP